MTGSHKPQHGSLSLLLAGKLDEGYADRLHAFDWQPFYGFNAGAAAIETLRKQLTGKADIVLIDSRTGVADAGGVCTVQMPDGIVLMTAANDQSFNGIERVGRAIAAGDGERAGREGAKVWVAVGRAPYLDVPEGESWFDKYGARFEEGYSAGLWAKSTTREASDRIACRMLVAGGSGSKFSILSGKTTTRWPWPTGR